MKNEFQGKLGDHILNGRMLRDFLKYIINTSNSYLCQWLGGRTHKLLGLCGTVSFLNIS